MTASTVTEQLGAYAPGGAIDECDMHIDLAKISAKTSTGAGAGISAAYDWRRLLDVFNVNSPYYDGLDNSGRGQVVDNQGTNAVLSNSLVAEVGELYEHGRINLLTAPSQVVQAMFAPLAYVAPATGDTLLASVPTWATAIANKRAGVTSGVPWKSPADILDLANAQTIFTAKTCDDDGNGAFKDYAKRCWLYNYISNWATIRSDCCAVYGTVRLNDTSVAGSSQIMGLRHFVAVMDRVPATAYQPIIPSGGLVKPNPNYQPPRRLLLTWLD